MQTNPGADTGAIVEPTLGDGVTFRRLEMERAVSGSAVAIVCTASLFPDLFGAWCLERNRTRFGWGTSSARHYYKDLASADDALRQWRQKLLEQGYRPRIDRRRTVNALACQSTPWAATADSDMRGLIDRCTNIIRDLHCQGNGGDGEAWAYEIAMLRVLLRAYDAPYAAAVDDWVLPVGVDGEDIERQLTLTIADLLIKLTRRLSSAPLGAALLRETASRLKREATPEVRGFVPARSRVYLSHSILSFLGDDRGFIQMGRRMAADGVDYLGDLVKLSPDKAAHYCAGDRNLLVRLRAALQQYGLSLNSDTPGWRRPERRREPRPPRARSAEVLPFRPPAPIGDCVS